MFDANMGKIAKSYVKRKKIGQSFGGCIGWRQENNIPIRIYNTQEIAQSHR